MMANSTTKPYAISFHEYGYWANGVPDKYFFDGDGSPGGGGGGLPDMLTGVQGIQKAYPGYPVWLTEVNVNADWGAAGQNDNELGAALWGALMQAAVPLHVGIIQHFDFSGSNLFGLVDGEGINKNSPTGKPMLSYYVLQQINKAFPQGSTLLQSSSAQSGILSLAARKPDGTVSVMIVNRQLSSNTVQSTCGTGGVPATVTVDLSAFHPTAITNTQIDKNNLNCSTWYAIAPTTKTLSTAQPVTLTFTGYGIAILNVVTNGTVVTSSATATSTVTPTTALGTTATPTPTSASSTYKITGLVNVERIAPSIPSAQAQGFTARFDKNRFKESAYSAGKLAQEVIYTRWYFFNGLSISDASSSW
jgi:hypothetical protein